MWRPSPEFEATYTKLFASWTDDAMTGMSPAERDFIIANTCLNQSLNGGLTLYYENRYGERAKEATEVFRRIGLARAAMLLERANRLMGTNGPSANQDERGEQLEALSEHALEEIVECSDALNAMEAEVRKASLRWVARANRP